ncbi:hypothetical protein KUV35_04750 [Marinobacter salsuginis]|uniref:DUF6694 family lipoprotein n=1 Tax=Marinobacter salsuginis TaxID=418719 RepID=UPI001C97978B|nr:DUF6694 family lipoprotein [Marinobacter salsuginis]MBY6070588.1 hypothetical protein [Marinobacter salsuginis]
MIYRLIAITFVSIILAGCGEQKIDGSSDASLKSSIADIKQSLPPEKAEEFSSAIQIIAFNQVDFESIMKGGANPDQMVSDAMASLDGKTPDDVIAEAQRLREQAEKRQAEREAKQKEQALAEIADLEQMKRKAEADAVKLQNFEVSKSRLYQRDDGFMKKPIIELTVTNNTSNPVARAFFEGVVATPGRSVPWIEDTFNYQIPGGLEPGETADWTLAPNMFSDWATEVPGDAILTLKAYKLEGPGYEISSNSFSERDAKRLEDLKEQYAN